VSTQILIVGFRFHFSGCREQKEKQEAKDRYWKLHVQGKTDEAKADLDRLKKIRAEREAAQAKRKAEAEGLYCSSPCLSSFLLSFCFLHLFISSPTILASLSSVRPPFFSSFLFFESLFHLHWDVLLLCHLVLINLRLPAKAAEIEAKKKAAASGKRV